jgi:hypothetical protein
MQSGVPEFYHIVFYLVEFTLYNSVNSRKKHEGICTLTAEHGRCLCTVLYSAGIKFYRLLTQLQQDP